MLKGVLELTFIPITIEPLVHPIPISWALLPLAQVLVTLWACPQSRAMLNPLQPLTGVNVPILPIETPKAFRLTIQEESAIYVSILEDLEAPPESQVVLPKSLIQWDRLAHLDQNTETMAIIVEHFPKVETVLVAFQFACKFLQQLCHIHSTQWLVMLTKEFI